MAGTVTFTEDKRVRNPALVKIAWTSATSEAADGTSTYRYTGAIVYAAFALGTTPTTGYDVVISDEDGNDVLNGLGANLTVTGTVYKHFKDGLGAVVDSKLTLAVTNAGEAKSGTIYLSIVR